MAVRYARRARARILISRMKLLLILATLLIPMNAHAAMKASGTFEVKLAPQTAAHADSAIARMSIDKQFLGDLQGSSKGEMLAVQTDVKGSAGYVAMERVSGTLAGRTGTFVLQHSGTMTRGEPHLDLTVVPDSGTGEFQGLTGRMTIDIRDGKHFYAFDYNLP
ncbi:MAG: hypothetical protein QOJ98_3093 [Acidobacteriota bacterium]|nr:hypothetical protein [Acidobacteriota bacterium]